jgi:AcrR family transcriptional regulator
VSKHSKYVSHREQKIKQVSKNTLYDLQKNIRWGNCIAMGRHSGSRNSDFEQTRKALLSAVRGKLRANGGLKTNFQDLAFTAGVSTTTLRHYFGSRQGLVKAILEHDLSEGAPYLLSAATQGPLTLRESLEEFAMNLRMGFEFGALRSHELGLSEGLGDQLVGPAYLANILEPTIFATESRFSRLIAAGTMPPCDVRIAALSFLSPLLLAVIHQNSLGGVEMRHLDLETFSQEHIERFLKAYSTPLTKSLITPPQPSH